MRGGLLGVEHLLELGFCEGGDAQFLGSGELAARARPGDDVARLLAHAPRGATATLPNQRFGVLAGEKLQRPGEDEGLSCEEIGGRSVLVALGLDPCGGEFFEESAVGRKPGEDALGGRTADIRRLGELLDAGKAERVERPEALREP